MAGFKFEDDSTYPLGYDTEYGSGRVLPGKGGTSGEDYVSRASGQLVGEEPSAVLDGDELDAMRHGGGPSRQAAPSS